MQKQLYCCAIYLLLIKKKVSLKSGSKTIWTTEVLLKVTLTSNKKMTEKSKTAHFKTANHKVKIFLQILAILP